jgi:hypothetical protein
MIAIILILTIILLLLYANFNCNHTLEENFIPLINSRIRPVIRNSRLKLNKYTDYATGNLSVFSKKIGLT